MPRFGRESLNNINNGEQKEPPKVEAEITEVIYADADKLMDEQQEEQIEIEKEEFIEIAKEIIGVLAMNVNAMVGQIDEIKAMLADAEDAEMSNMIVRYYQGLQTGLLRVSAQKKPPIGFKFSK